MNSPGSSLILLGSRGSGKTTFLAALWHLLEAKERPSSIITRKLQPDRAYLNGIRDAWLELREVGRTSLQSFQTVKLALHDVAAGSDFDLTFPDPSGEIYRDQWAMRRATADYINRARSCRGILLFIQPKVRRPERISAAWRTSTAAHTEAKANESRPSGDETSEWRHETAPTQVQLVELLQFVTRLRPLSAKLPVSVVISAWDEVQDRLAPASWLEKRLTLLWQYLRANSSRAPYSTFGISAIGGNLELDRGRLKLIADPSSRVQVVEEGKEPHHDLSAPIRFLVSPHEAQ